MKIKEIRIKKGITQSELAEKLRITQGAVSQWEQGLSTPKADKLIEVATVLGCSVDELLRE